MSTILKSSVTAKTFAVVAGVAMAFTFAFAPVSSVQAASLTDDQVQSILSLLESFGADSATMANVEASLTGGTPVTGGSTTGGTCAYTFTQDLSMGADSAEVMQVQKFLNAKGFMVASTGAGSPGMESTYFGGLTKAAVAAFQNAYASEILAPVGLTSGTGYWGPSTRAKANMLCADMDDADDDDMDDVDGGDLEGGAGDITVSQTSSKVDDEVVEGEEDIQILGFDIEADDSDVEITSIRVEFEYEGATTGSDNIERYVDEVSIWMDGEMVGQADADEFDEDDDIYSENIAIDGAVIRDGDESRFYVAVSAVNNIDSDDVSEDWEVALGQIRFMDGSGAILTDNSGDGATAGSGDGDIAETFTFEDLSTAGDVQLTINEEDDDVNEAHYVEIDETSDTNDVPVLSFTLEAEGSDMVIEQLIFDISSTGAGVTEIANDFRLLMDGEDIGDASYDLDQNNTGGESSAPAVDTDIAIIFSDLDDEDAMIEEGDIIEFTLVADINDTDGNFTDGDSLTVSLSGNTTDVDAEDENGDSVTDISGSADTDDITFVASGILATVVDTSKSKDTNAADDVTDDEGVYEVEFTVTAVEDAAWIELDTSTSTDAAADDVGVAFSIEDSANVAQVAGTSSKSVLAHLSGGSRTGNYVKINAGQSATFLLTAIYDAASAGSYRAQLTEIGYNQASAAAADEALELVPEYEWETGTVSLE